jgi:xanthine/CO dehydrogenase XdhC/CoxF family maturation factor
MRTVYDELATWLENQQRVALATVVRTRGSTPQKVGAKMLISPDGRTQGTIGGGCVEAAVWKEAVAALQEGKPRVVEVDLNDDVMGDVCGGTLTVFEDVWCPESVHA